MPARISLAGPQSDVQGRMATATTGTGTLTLGSAAANATTFAGMPVPINDGDTLTYELVDIGVAPPGKEKGRGTYHAAGPTLSRDSVIWSTAGGAKLNLSGNATVFVTADDSDVVLTSQARTLLTTATTFYIATNGSDANPGTAALPWLTFAHAMAVITGAIDFGGQVVTLQAQSGHAAFTSPLIITPWTGGGNFIYDGGGGSITATNTDAIHIGPGSLPGSFTYQNVTLSTSGSPAPGGTAANVAHVAGGTVIQGPGVTHGACAGAHLSPGYGAGARLTLANSYTISGAAQNHYKGGTAVIDGGSNPITVTIVGNPQFSTFVFVANGVVDLSAVTFSGARTGYQTGSALLNGVIFRNTGAANALPGNGTVALSSGGQFIP